MYEPENENEISHQTEEDSGEYRYGGGFEKEDIYADAHYTPAGESTVPPRYYTPPEPKKTVKREKSGRGGRIAGIICLCLVCAMLGGLVGGGLMAGRLDERVDALEQARAETVLTQAAKSASAAESATPAASVAAGGTLTAAQIYEQACRQVVGITTEVTYTNFFGMNSSSAVSGTGFIVSADGYILTNYHVIELAAQNTKDVNVILHDGTRYTAAIVGYEKYNDLAVLKIDAEGLSPVTFGDSSSISVGDTVYAVGNPLGELDFSMSTGHVSALDRLITSDESGVAINMFQIDAAVNSGNSGGPVYNAAGEVVGIVTAKYASTGVEGLGFAIPTTTIKAVTDQLIATGRYVRPGIGITVGAIDSEDAAHYGLPGGLYVSSVSQNSDAAAKGVREGDILTHVNGFEVRKTDDVLAIRDGMQIGDTMTLTIYRDGEILEIEIELYNLSDLY